MRRLALGITIIVAVAAAGAGGFLIGRSQARKIVEVKVTSAATLQAEANKHFNAGEAAGRQSGEQDGFTRGYTAGTDNTKQIVRGVVKHSFNAGYKAAFHGFGSGWTIGDYYIVKIAPGQIGVPYELATRIQMDSASFYDQCPNGTDICTGLTADLTPAPSAPSSPGSVPIPTIPSVPITPTGPGANSLPTYPVPCGDGTISPSGGHSGACSHHRGTLY